MTANFTKIVRLGTIPTHPTSSAYMSVFAKIEFTDGKLSISGVEGPIKGGNAKGGCGQIVMSMDAAYIGRLNLAPGWTLDMVAEFISAWKAWHLNDMRAGTPEQMAILEKHKSEYPGYPRDYYSWACEVLAAQNMLEHNGYRYGTAWLGEEVPADVLTFLKGLPDTDKQPAWV